jgi:hypothetical protein
MNNEDENEMNKGDPPFMTQSEIAGTLIIIVLIAWMLFH